MKPTTNTPELVSGIKSACHFISFPRIWVFLFLGFIESQACLAQFCSSELKPLFTQPKQYVAHYTKEAPRVDGTIEKSVWKQAEWSDSFIDIEGSAKPLPPFATRVKMLWNDSYLFIAAEMEEPHVWATLKKHDEIVFHDNDFEVFIDPENNTHQYYEIEVNALNTIFDLFMSKPYRNNSGAMIHWNVDQLQSAVQVQGTLNDPSDKDAGWTVEMAIPFRSVTIGNEPKIPEEGTLWRINFSRVEWDVDILDGKYVKRKGTNGKPLPEHNWVWSPQGVINMHFPERWGYLHFTYQKKGRRKELPELDYAEKQKQYLWLVYYKQQEYFQKNGEYADSFEKIGLSEFMENNTFLLEEQTNRLELEASRYQFMAYVQGSDQKCWSINQEGLVQLLKK